MFRTIVGYLKPRHHHAGIMIEYDAQTVTVEHRSGESSLLLITDRNVPGRRSVTNGIEDVLAHQVQCGNLRPGMFVLYRDSEMMWDQACIDDECRFAGFRSINESIDINAIHRVLMLEHAYAR